ncbi:hypothetical protein [Roseivivax halodurans]|uniref:hypothetical protein n=1 Tax=Roseivivax halodurans TaxID=93683 RepID=UPI0012FC09D0|nr:hypothetical protein [Roseivivax halodurans]
MLIIFDTCTKPDYYGDVHKVLASPTGAIIRYDYERKLWTDGAQAEAEQLLRSREPIPALLLYGQVRDYSKGAKDPSFMLTFDNAIFIPTRYASVVNFGVDAHAESERDNLYLHLEMDEFVSPDNPELPKLIKELENRKQLPFDREQAYKWVSKCPENIDIDMLSKCDEKNWPLVVDRFASAPSQFEGDVFWRFNAFSKVSSNSENTDMELQKRVTNKIGSIQSFHSDFLVDDLNEYAVSVRNYIPNAEEKELPPRAAISVKEDTSKLLVLPDHNVKLRRNASDQLKVGVSQINFLNSRFAKLVVETEIPDHEGAYPAGSSIEVTLELRKNRGRLLFTMLAALFAFVSAGAAAVLMRQDVGQGIACLMFSVLLFWLATWLWTGAVNPLKRS